MTRAFIFTTNSQNSNIELIKYSLQIKWSILAT